jgi:hypothetical protein
MPPEEVVVLQQQVATLQAQQAGLEARQARFEERFDRVTDKLFSKMDEQATEQRESIQSLHDSLAPVLEWVNKGKGAFLLVATFGMGILGLILWLIKKAFPAVTQ